MLVLAGAVFFAACALLVALIVFLWNDRDHQRVDRALDQRDALLGVVRSALRAEFRRRTPPKSPLLRALMDTPALGDRDAYTDRLLEKVA